jgi:CheY-like chemotaxis protein
LHANRPQTKALLMTAYGDQQLKEDLHRRGAARVLSKPFDDILQFPKIVEDALK